MKLKNLTIAELANDICNVNYYDYYEEDKLSFSVSALFVSHLHVLVL